jgi:hypothetical protein
MKNVKFAAFVLLCGTCAANGQFFTYAQWEAMPPQERVVYIAGAFDMMISTAAPNDKYQEHYRKCVVDSKMNLNQLSENIRIFASTRPKLQNGPISGPVINYLPRLPVRDPRLHLECVYCSQNRFSIYAAAQR